MKTIKTKLAFAVGAVFILCHLIFAQDKPVISITYDQAQTLFDGKAAKMVIAYPAPVGWSTPGPVYLIDFKKNPLQLDLVCNNATNAGDPMISPDGSRVAYNFFNATVNKNEVHVCSAVAGGANDTKICDQGFDQRWWIHPVTKDEYLIWVNQEANNFTNVSGITYIQKMVKGTCTPDGPTKTLLSNYALRCGRTPAGEYMFTNQPGNHLFRLSDPLGVENVTATQVWTSGDRNCNGSISQDPERPTWFLWEDGDHETMNYDTVANYVDKSLWAPYRIAVPGVPYGRIQCIEWSTNPGYITGSPSEPNDWQTPASHDGFVFKFTDKNVKPPAGTWTKICQYARACHLWVSAGNEISLPLSKVIINPGSANVLPGATKQFVATGTDANSVPVAQQPSFSWSTTGGGTINNSGLYTASNTAGGPYKVIATTTNGSNLACTSSVTITNVSQGTALPAGYIKQGLVLCDNAGSSHLASTLASAIESNYTGNNATAPAINSPFTAGSTTLNWTPQADNDGLWFTDGTENFSAYLYIPVINATSRQVKLMMRHDDNVTVWMNGTQVAQINGYDGGNEGSSAIFALPSGTNNFLFKLQDGGGGHVMAARFTDGSGNNLTDLQTVLYDTTPISPDQVATPTIYPIGADRTFSGKATVYITCATTGADIYYTLDGALPTQSSLHYTTNFSISTSCTIKARAYKTGMSASNSDSAAFVNSALGKVLYPDGGELLAVGQQVTVRWVSYDTTKFSAALINISVDSGRTWKLITPTSIYLTPGTATGQYAWTVPASVGGKSLIGKGLIISVWQYSGPFIDQSDSVFTISSTATLRNMERTQRFVTGIRNINGNFLITVSKPGNHVVDLFNSRGQVVYSVSGSGPQEYVISHKAISHGIYIAKIVAGNQTLVQMCR